MRKYYGRENKGFEKGRQTQLRIAIRRRRQRGETAYNSKKLAEIYDRHYGTNFAGSHSGPWTFTK